MTFPKLKKEDSDLLKKIKDNQLKDLQYKTESLIMEIFYNLSRLIMIFLGKNKKT